MKGFLRCLTVFSFAVALVFSLLPIDVHAESIYGRGSYSSGCPYQQNCPPPSEPEPPVVTASGLQVSINLSDGQKIPDTGYTIVVTPLNGQGQTFQKVEFYLDGALISTFFPSDDGTARWDWDTSKHRGTHVKIIIYDQNGEPVTKEYDITIVSASSSPKAVVPPVDNSIPALIGRTAETVVKLVDEVIEVAKDVVRSIPEPVARTIPYNLIMVLLVIIVLLLWQSRQEIAALERQQTWLKRAQRLVEEKDGFIQLTSHYLRTPFTIIQGGVSLLPSLKPAPSAELLAKLNAMLNDFHSAIEALLAQNANQNLQTIKPPETKDLKPAWRAPLFIIPVVTVGLLALAGNWLVANTHRSAFSWFDTVAQIGLFIAFATGLFIIIRSRQLRHQNKEQTDQENAQQLAIDEARNNLIQESAGVLSTKLSTIQSFIPQLPEGQATQFMNKGINDMVETLKRFRDTATVKPPLTTMPFKPFSLGSVLSRLPSTTTETAKQKQVSILPPEQDISLASQQPAWVAQVVGTVVDNAVAYSPEKASVEVSAKKHQHETTVTVQDHGKGIEREKLDILFQPFSKAEGAMQFDHPGLGLSLYLDRLLMVSLGGNITIDSEPGHGTLVKITFPTN